MLLRVVAIECYIFDDGVCDSFCPAINAAHRHQGDTRERLGMTVPKSSNVICKGTFDGMSITDETAGSRETGTCRSLEDVEIHIFYQSQSVQDLCTYAPLICNHAAALTPNTSLLPYAVGLFYFFVLSNRQSNHHRNATSLKHNDRLHRVWVLDALQTLGPLLQSEFPVRDALDSDTSRVKIAYRCRETNHLRYAADDSDLIAEDLSGRPGDFGLAASDAEDGELAAAANVAECTLDDFFDARSIDHNVPSSGCLARPHFFEDRCISLCTSKFDIVCRHIQCASLVQFGTTQGHNRDVVAAVFAKELG